METVHAFSYSCLLVGILVILGVFLIPKQKIGLKLFKAGIYIAVPLLILWFCYYIGLGFAENLLMDLPYQIPLFLALFVYAYKLNGFSKKNTALYILFLIGFLLIYFGLFLELVVANLSIGF